MLSFPSSAHVTLFIHFPSYQHYHIVPSILLCKILMFYMYFMVKKASATHRPKSSPPPPLPPFLATGSTLMAPLWCRMAPLWCQLPSFAFGALDAEISFLPAQCGLCSCFRWIRPHNASWLDGKKCFDDRG